MCVKEGYSDKLDCEVPDITLLGVGIDVVSGAKVGKPRISVLVRHNESLALVPDFIEGCRVKKNVGFVVPE